MHTGLVTHWKTRNFHIEITSSGFPGKVDMSGNLAGAIPTLQKSAGAVSAAQSKQTCGAVPHGTSSLIHCHDISGPLWTSEFETSVLLDGDVGKATAS